MDLEYTLMCITGGMFISLVMVLWVIIVVALWVGVSPFLGATLALGPVGGYLYSKPEWISKMWKQKEYRE